MYLRNVRHILPLLPILMLFGSLTGCSSNQESADDYRPLFGNGLQDRSQPVARVGDVVITQNNMEQRLREVPPQRQAGYQGQDGQRLLLDVMINEALYALGAVNEELYNDPDVRQTLISMRREMLTMAMRSNGVLKGHEPTEEELRQFYQDNHDNYRTLATMRVRHIECMEETSANAAWEQLQGNATTNQFPVVCNKWSVNKITSINSGDTGWFNPGQYVKDIPYPTEFTAAAGELKMGLNRPIKAGNRWHVIEVLSREEPRYQAFNEAREKVRNDMLPGYQEALLRDYLRQARNQLGVEMLGSFSPGQGLTPEQLFAQAMNMGDPEKAVDFFRIIYLDYPESEEADNALFMCGTISLKAWNDRQVGARYLRLLITEYPDSELVDDAQLILDNLYNPAFWEPQSIEDLRKINH